MTPSFGVPGSVVPGFDREPHTWQRIWPKFDLAQNRAKFSQISGRSWTWPDLSKRTGLAQQHATFSHPTFSLPKIYPRSPAWE